MDVVDVKAREMAQQALAEMRQHAAVCAEAEKSRQRSFEDIRNLVITMQKTYVDGQETMADRLLDRLKAAGEGINKRVDDVDEKANALFARFWWLAITYGTGVTAVAWWALTKSPP